MLEKLIWKSVFLSTHIKKKVVSFYENTEMHFQHAQYSDKSSLYKCITNHLTESVVSYMCKKVHKNWLKQYNINHSLINVSQFLQYSYHKDIPMLFGLLLEKENKVEKFKKLVDWGLNVEKIYHINGYDFNLSQQVLWAYNESLLTSEETKEILHILIEKGSSIVDNSYLISHYEKGVSLLKQEKQAFVDINQDKILQNKKTMDKVFSWIDKSLYSYLLSSGINNKTKSLLEYLQLKRQIQEVYLEKWSSNISNVRQKSNEVIIKNLYVIEDIIKRKYIFHNQSSIYNSLVLLFSLPEFNEKLNNCVVADCYQYFNVLNSKAKRFLLGNLIDKNKEVVLTNLLYQNIDINWSIVTEDGENILGLSLLAKTDFIQSVISNYNFNLLICNTRGNNLLHVLESLPLNENPVKEKIKQRISQLSEKEKNQLFYQINDNNMTPLIKAIKERNTVMVDLLLDIGVSGIKQRENKHDIYKSALDFVKHELNIISNENTQTIMNIENPQLLKEQWLYNLYKNFTIEKNYQYMTNKLSLNKTKEKVVKI